MAGAAGGRGGGGRDGRVSGERARPRPQSPPAARRRGAMDAPPDRPALPPRGMAPEAFRAAAAAAASFISDYHARLDAAALPVRSQVAPGYLRPLLPAAAPEVGDPDFTRFLADVDACILPGVTHWQHPSFLAYYPANATYPAMLGELVAAGLGVIGFSWAGSPACTELEVVLLDWLAAALGLPAKVCGVCVWGGRRAGAPAAGARSPPSASQFLSPASPDAPPDAAGGGALQCTASDAVLVALLAARQRARERALGEAAAAPPDSDTPDATLDALYAFDARLVMYASDQAHACVAKAARAAGVHRVRLLRAAGAAGWALCPDALAAAMDADLAAGRVPFFVVATVGTTSVGASDPVDALAAAASSRGAWTHVDAAFAGVSFLAPELRRSDCGMGRGVDSFSTNLHKAGLTNFDAAPLWVSDSRSLRAALTLNPTYLRAPGNEHDLKDWQVPLGRRFRALKVWAVLRVFGVAGMREHVRRTAALGGVAADAIEKDATFELAAPRAFGLALLRLPAGAPEGALDAALEAVNASGAAFMVGTDVGGARAVRVAVGGCATRGAHVRAAVGALRDAVAAELGRGGGRPV